MELQKNQYSIFLTVILLPFVLFLAVRQGHAYTRATFSFFRYTLKRVDVPLLFFLAVMSYCSSFLSSDPLMHLPIKELILIKSNVTLTFYFHPVSSSIITCMAFQLEVFTGPKIPARTQKAPEMYYPEPNQNWLLFQSWSRTLQELRNVSPKPGWETQT